MIILQNDFIMKVVSNTKRRRIKKYRERRRRGGWYSGMTPALTERRGAAGALGRRRQDLSEKTFALDINTV
jgi:hypothetical protein